MTPFISRTEAAYIADLSERDFQRILDQDIVPRELIHVEGDKYVSRLAAAFVRFCFETEASFSTQFRRNILHVLAQRTLNSRFRDELLGLEAASKKASWRVIPMEYTEVNLGIAIESTRDKARTIVQADKLIQCDPEIMGGLPVFAGTRVPVDNVMASLNKGTPLKQLQEDYPFLTAEHIEAAAIYRLLHPAEPSPEPPANLLSTNPDWRLTRTRKVRAARV